MKILLALLACSLSLCAQAQFDDGSALLAFQRSQPSGGGSPTWQDNIAPAATDTDDTPDNTTPLYQKITVATTGTATKLRVYSSQSLGGNIKIALYDSSKVLLASGTVACPADVAPHQFEVTISSTSVTSGRDYYVGFLTDTSSLQTFRYQAGVGTRLFKFGVSYASFPNNPIAEDGSQSNSHSVGIFITP